MNSCKEIGSFGVVGSGIMGCGIVEVAASRGGFDRVVMQDIDQAQLDLAMARISKDLGKLVEKGKIDEAAKGETLGRIEATVDPGVLAGCGFVPQKVEVGDPLLKPMWQAAETFDREAYGFSSLPTTGDIRLEEHSRSAYDTMIHIYAKTSRTIAFRRTPAGYRWIHEQESFQGPRQYTSVDGTFNEQIVLTFEVEPVAGPSTNQLSVSYWGEDPRLADRRDLKLEDVDHILHERGYHAI